MDGMFVRAGQLGQDVSRLDKIAIVRCSWVWKLLPSGRGGGVW